MTFRAVAVTRLAKAGAIVALAFALAGCAAGPSASPVATDKVDLPPSYVFSPTAITVPVGTTVTWTNDDNFTHSVEFLDGGLPTTPNVLRPGGTTFSFTFTAPGLYHYQCSFHPQNMQGTVLVTAP